MISITADGSGLTEHELKFAAQNMEVFTKTPPNPWRRGILIISASVIRNDDDERQTLTWSAPRLLKYRRKCKKMQTGPSAFRRRGRSTTDTAEQDRTARSEFYLIDKQPENNKKQTGRPALAA